MEIDFSRISFQHNFKKKILHTDNFSMVMLPTRVKFQLEIPEISTTIYCKAECNGNRPLQQEWEKDGGELQNCITKYGPF